MKKPENLNPVRLLPYADRLKLYEKEKDQLLREERSLPASEFQRKLQALFKKYDL
jgi:hypothetical protein